MENKIVWILMNNLLYCSEIKKHHIGSPSKYHITLDLNPIIGDIDCISITKGQAISDSVTLCEAFNAADTFSKPAFVSFSFDEIIKHHVV